MSLKSKNGKLLASSGHLCTTCCNSCTDPWTWTNGLLGGTEFSEITPQNIRFSFQDSANCGGSNSNTQFGWADACAIAPFDGYLRIVATGRVETQNIGFEELKVTINNRQVLYGASFENDGGCDMADALVSADVPVSAGEVVIIQVATTTGDPNFHFGAFWDVAFNWSVQVSSVSPRLMSSAPPLQPACTPLAKSRFEVCKKCPDSPDGFSCRLTPGCCFGRRRSDPSFHCPANKW